MPACLSALLLLFPLTAVVTQRDAPPFDRPLILASHDVDAGADAAEEDSSLDLDQELFEELPLRIRRVDELSSEERNRLLHIARQVHDADRVRLADAAGENVRQRRAELPDPLHDPGPGSSLYFDVMRFPDRHRGRPLRFEGRIGRVAERTLGPETPDARTVYEVWVYTPESENPLVAFCTHVPEDLPLGDQLLERGGVAGYVVGLYAYGESDPERFAPLLMAPELDWQPQTGSTPMQIDLAILAPIEHRTRGVRSAERDAYYRVLRFTLDTDYAEQTQAAREQRARRIAEWERDPQYRGLDYRPFVDLFRHPDEWLGRPVTLTGHVRQWRKIQDEGDYGVGPLYELWLYTEDSQGNPAVVVCSSVPDDLPRIRDRQDVLDGVTVTGYFFKMYGYTAEDTTRVAPLILARQVEWQPVETRGMPVWIQPLIGAVAVVVLLGVLAYLYAAGRRDREFRKRRREKHPEAGAAGFDQIAGSEADNPWAGIQPSGLPEADQPTDADDAGKRRGEGE